MTAAVALGDTMRRALERRKTLIDRLHETGTDCYRLLHGAQEGAPGVTVDRYGSLALLQSFHAPLPTTEVTAIARSLAAVFPQLEPIYNDRSAAGSRVRNRLGSFDMTAARSDRIVSENGVRFYVRARHRGNDPWLFLDLRPTRRAVMEEAAGKSLLNLFAYTCGVGVAAAVSGASSVLNVDFAASSLAVGRDNALLNGVEHVSTDLASDVFPAVRQIAGVRQPHVVRGKRLPHFPQLESERFDLTFLDPPPHSKSAFGVVDLRVDYPALLKPVLATVVEHGAIYCTNNIASVDEDEWHGLLKRCAAKHGRPIRSLDVIRPGDDFPSNDGRPPLKVARLQL